MIQVKLKRVSTRKFLLHMCWFLEVELRQKGLAFIHICLLSKKNIQSQATNPKAKGQKQNRTNPNVLKNVRVKRSCLLVLYRVQKSKGNRLREVRKVRIRIWEPQQIKLKMVLNLLRPIAYNLVTRVQTRWPFP